MKVNLSWLHGMYSISSSILIPTCVMYSLTLIVSGNYDCLEKAA